MADGKNIKIIQTVASGGTAVLYKAIQVSLDRVVAVKRLHPHLTTDENFTRRFILEAKAAASLDHENIVRVIDFGVEDDCYQIVMEYVEGESLKDVLERWRPISPELSLALVHQICCGLEHAHAKGIVHRDIKPGNVMITKTGIVKITDFGLAKLTHSTGVQTAVDSILGTPLYMSPEQAFGESVDQRSDLFSLGTVLYELLTGRQPFASENYMGVIQNILHKEIPNVCELNDAVPQNVEAVVARALARNRDERFQSAREFRETIVNVLGLDGLRRSLGRLPALLERSADTRLIQRPDMPRPSKNTAWASTSSAMKRKKSRSPVLTAVGMIVLVVGGAAGYYFFGPPSLSLGRGAARPGTIMQGSTLGDGLETAPASALGADSAAAAQPATAAPDTVAPEPTASAVTAPVQAAPAPVDTASTPEAPPAPGPESSGSQAAATPPPVASEPAPAPSQPEPAPREPAPEPERFREGYLMVSVEPLGQIYVDGVYRGLANPTLRLTLNAGIHDVECRNEKHETYRETLHVVAGELSRRSIILNKLKGTISLAATEGAELFIDGEFVGTTPIMRPIRVDAGSHTLTLKKLNYYTWTSQVSVEANATLPLRITLSPQY